MRLEVWNAGRMGYADAYRIQTQWMAARIAGGDAHPDRFLLVEHDPVYTLGRHAEKGNLLWNPADLASRGIDVVQTDRGGQVTYHGPGQVTGYPIVKLSVRRGQGVAWYVHGLEEVLIRTLRHFGLDGKRDAINPGVWLGRDKVAAIGVRVQRQVTMHGFALNVRANLEHYDGIIPCGIRERGVTSMHAHCVGLTRADVIPVLIASFGDVFGYPGIVFRDKE
ncbi:MAG: lipoyl(octanoyl) transferase LipB [Kiritimatiellia bacterium]